MKNTILKAKNSTCGTILTIYEWVQECTDWYTIGTVDGEIVSYSVETRCKDVLVASVSYTAGGTVSGGSAGSTGGGGAAGDYTPPAPCNCTDKCPVCNKCLSSNLKSAPVPAGGTETTKTTDPCEYCKCPPLNPIPSISSLSVPFAVVAKMTVKEVYYLIGGNVLLNYKNNPTAFSNACALRLSYALNSISGHEIPFAEGETLSGDVNNDGNKEWYFYRVSDMVSYLNRVFGSCTLTDTNSIVGMTGIIWQSNCGWDDASGHIDIWNKNNALGHYYDSCSVVYIWRN